MVRKQRRFKTPSPKKLVGAFLLVICLLFVLFPLLLMAAASFMPEDELAANKMIHYLQERKLEVEELKDYVG